MMIQCWSGIQWQVLPFLSIDSGPPPTKEGRICRNASLNCNAWRWNHLQGRKAERGRNACTKLEKKVGDDNMIEENRQAQESDWSERQSGRVGAKLSSTKSDCWSEPPSQSITSSAYVASFKKTRELRKSYSENMTLFCNFSKSWKQKKCSWALVTATRITFIFYNRLYIKPTANAPKVFNPATWQ